MNIKQYLLALKRKCQISFGMCCTLNSLITITRHKVSVDMLNIPQKYDFRYPRALYALQKTSNENILMKNK